MLVYVVARDPRVLQGIQKALEPSGKWKLEVLEGTLSDYADHIVASPPAIVIVDLAQPTPSDLAALGAIRTSTSSPGHPAIIVIAGDLNAMAARALLRANVSDWLPQSFSSEELLNAVHQSLRQGAEGDHRSITTTVTFMPAVGGAGASTLSLAALEVLGGASRERRSQSCVVDLNLTNGTVPDYLDVSPNLDLGEIADAPHRLDSQLLEVMLTRHKSGYSAICAMPGLFQDSRIGPDIIGRLLDLASIRFSTLIIDLPGLWSPWSENVLRGSDQFYIVTDMSVTGFRHALRMAEMIVEGTGVAMKRSVIVNKAPWLSDVGVKQKNAVEVLGKYLAGFVPMDLKHVRMAQNQGVLLSEIKKSSAVSSALQKILSKSAPAAGSA